MQEVTDLSLILKALCLQPYPFAVRFLHRLIHQSTHLLNLGNCQLLRHREYKKCCYDSGVDKEAKEYLSCAC